MHCSSSWSRTLLLACLSSVLLLISLPSSTTAQSDNCHSCIKRTIPTVTNCTALTPAQLTTLDTVIHGQAAFQTPSLYQTSDPVAYQCLVALMWDVIHYKAQLWGGCFDPQASCPWTEMMQYLEMIPKIASIYGVQNPPAQVLIDPPQ